MSCCKWPPPETLSSKDGARELNEDIFETIYFAACEASMELAQVDGPYETYGGSAGNRTPRSGRWDWQGLKQKIVPQLQLWVYGGARLAQLPAGGSNAYGQHRADPGEQRVLRALHAGRTDPPRAPLVNRHLLKDLIKRGLWSDEMRTKLIAHNGSAWVAHGWPWGGPGDPGVPMGVGGGEGRKDLYKTVWEIKQRRVLDLAADRGLKTGLYYLRTKAAADAIKFTVDVDALKTLRSSGRLALTWPKLSLNAARKTNVASDSDSTTASVKTATTTASSASLEKSVIQSLKAEGPKYTCENCSA
eukprot:Skav213487  [mRNA]  locus=scaffold3849:46672:54687:- [translate_table: standard]